MRTTRTRRNPDGTFVQCSITECENPVRARDLCTKHYQRQTADRPLDLGRDQAGPRNNQWLGDEAGYSALHGRVRRLRGMPQRCERCGTEEVGVKYEWANLTGNYADPYDFERMCKACHQMYDRRRNPAEAKHGTHAGWMWHTRRKQAPCEDCRVAQNAYCRERHHARKTARVDVPPAGDAHELEQAGPPK